MPNKFKEPLIIFLVLLLSLVLRLVSINQSLWLDEAISALAVKNYSFDSLITSFSLGDTHPPLYYLLLKAWAFVFGFSEVSLRAPSVIFGILTVYLVYKIGTLLVNNKSGIASAILLATGPLHIYYSQEARMYAMSTFWVSLVVYSFIKERWRMLSVSILLVGLTDYLPLLILFPLWIFGIYSRKDKDFLSNFAKSHIPVFIFLVFWFPIFLKQSASTSAYLANNPWWQTVLGTANLKELALVWIKFMIGRISFENNLVYAIVVLVISSFLIVPLYKAFAHRKNIIVLWLWFVVPAVIFFTGSFFIPGFSYFRLLFLTPPFYLILAYGFSKMSISRFLVGAIILINTIFSFAYLTNSIFWREDWRSLVSFIERRIKVGEAVLVSYQEPFAGYLWYSKKKDFVKTFSGPTAQDRKALYTLDYLMDLTDPQRENYQMLKIMGFSEFEIFNFRGVGQVRYWKKS